MGLVQEQTAFLLDLCKLVYFATERGWQVTLGEGFRTPEQQAIYFKEGKSKTMNSNHLRRLAQDYCFIRDGVAVWTKSELQPVGNYWESLNPKNRWGGNFHNFPDTPHFERNLLS